MTSLASTRSSNGSPGYATRILGGLPHLGHFTFNGRSRSATMTALVAIPYRMVGPVEVGSTVILTSWPTLICSACAAVT